MATTFLTEDFLLQGKIARRLYHEYAEQMPIYDYHCHLPAGLIAEDHLFENITRAWLAGDHYKWRAMRANGVDERYITGDAPDNEKFEKWAQTVPSTLRNPLYHWTHLELKRYFGINDLLSGDNAKDIYDACSELLNSEDFSVCKLLSKMNVDLVCTTEGPLDNLVHHRKIRENSGLLKVYTAFRPDKSFATEDLPALNIFIDKLGQLCGREIRTFDSYIETLRLRHEFFHNEGCRLSDYGLETAYAEQYGADEIAKIFEKIRTNRPLDMNESLKFKSAMMFELASMDAETGWVMQLHIGALRNNNSKMLAKLGPDTGYDSIGDLEIARPLSIFLDRLNTAGKLPKTILYNLNPKDSAVIATMAGNFQDGSCPGKIQYGPAWWFLDQKNGMEDQIEMLSNMGLLSRFVGMTTDSRSFLSFPRHEYFRRILCNIIGGDVEQGLLPNDMELLGKMVEDICFNNAERYFAMSLD
ncbi:MAG: glucuronate isomerase [Phycisphaerae bacterium]|jgi:glucuronate isomerase